MTDIIFRGVERDDVQELKDLHMECFPIQYDDIFFENICNGKGFKNASLYTQVAVELESSTIVGCILGQFSKSTKCEDNGFFSELKNQAKDVFYVLTLGLRNEYRRSGLGTALLLESLNYAKKNNDCGAVYLHVIHYNKAAMKFYEKNGFIFLRELDEFYVIEKIQHSAYVYILYMNGFGPPLLTKIFQKAKIITDSSFRMLISWISLLIPKMHFTNSSNNDSNTLSIADSQIDDNDIDSDSTDNDIVRNNNNTNNDITEKLSKRNKTKIHLNSKQLPICSDCQHEKIEGV